MASPNCEAVIEKAKAIAELMHEICALADQDRNVGMLVCASYPFSRSLDEVADQVIMWRDAMKEVA